MKILYVITKANWGGAQRYVFELATSYPSREDEVVVACGGKGIFTEKLETAGIRTIILPISNEASVGALFHTGKALHKLFRREKPDIVHLNSSLVGAAGAFAARKAAIPQILFTAHGWAFNETRALWQIGLIRLISWLTILLSHVTICVSEAVRRDVRWFPLVSKKLVVIHNGIRAPRFLQRAEARHKLAPQFGAEFWIGMISELHPTKRVEDAVWAFSTLASHQPEIGLVILGEGVERRRLEELIEKLRLQTRIRLAGFVTDAPEYLRAFDLFVHSSQSEALGLAVLEAGSASLPVIATRVGGIPEIITDEMNGLLVPPREPETLATAMERMIEQPTLAHSYGEHLQERVRSAFSQEQMCVATFALYKKR